MTDIQKPKGMNGEFAKLSRMVLAEETQRIVDIHRKEIIHRTEQRLQAMGHVVDLDAAEAAMKVASHMSETPNG